METDREVHDMETEFATGTVYLLIITLHRTISKLLYDVCYACWFICLYCMNRLLSTSSNVYFIYVITFYSVIIVCN